MPEFSYKCVNSNGQLKSGSLHALNEEQAIKRLRNEGLHPTSITEQAEAKLSGSPGFGSVRLNRLAAYTRKLAQLVRTDIPISEVFAIMAEGEEGILLKQASVHVSKETSMGTMLGEAMAGYPRVFSPLYIRMIEAGINSGTLDKIADNLAKLFESEHAIKMKIRSKMVYPVLCLIMAFVVGIILIYVGRLPVSVISSLAVFWAMIVGLVIFGMTRLGYGIYRQIGFKLPGIGSFMRKVNLARFCRIFGLQFASGVPILEGLAISKKILQDNELEAAVGRLETHIHDGGGLRDGMIASGIFPSQMTGMIGVGEKAGGIDFMLEKLAEYYELDVGTAATVMATIFSFVVFMLAAITVAIVVISFWSGYFAEIGSLIDAV